MIAAFEPTAKFGHGEGDSRALFAFVAFQRRDSFPASRPRDGASAQGCDALESLTRRNEVFPGGDHFQIHHHMEWLS